MPRWTRTFIIAIALAHPLFSAENYIESTAGASAIALGLMEIQPVTGAALKEDPSQIIKNDLEWPGRFRIISAKRVDSLRWVREQAYSYIFGNYWLKGDSIDLTLGLTDLISMEPVAGVGGKMRIHKNHLRPALHKFSDQIVKQYYGEEGVASSRVLFVRKKGKTREVWMMDYDGARQQQITHEGSIVMMPNWSADGSTIFYTSFLDGYPNLRMISAGERKSKRVLPQGIHAYGAKANPDGERIVYSRQTQQGANDLWIYNLKTGANQRLTYHPAIETSPEWAPNGWSIAFTSDKGGRPQLYTIEADGTGEERLTYVSTYVESAAWSPQGDKIAYCAMIDGKFDLFVLNIGTGQTTQLTSGLGNDETPSWSADGRLIMFASDRTGSYQLYLIRPDGSGLVQLTRSAESSSAPRWSPRRK